MVATPARLLPGPHAKLTLRTTPSLAWEKGGPCRLNTASACRATLIPPSACLHPARCTDSKRAREVQVHRASGSVGTSPRSPLMPALGAPVRHFDNGQQPRPGHRLPDDDPEASRGGPYGSTFVRCLPYRVPRDDRGMRPSDRSARGTHHLCGPSALVPDLCVSLPSANPTSPSGRSRFHGSTAPNAVEGRPTAGVHGPTCTPWSLPRHPPFGVTERVRTPKGHGAGTSGLYWRAGFLGTPLRFPGVLPRFPGAAPRFQAPPARFPEAPVRSQWVLSQIQETLPRVSASLGRFAGTPPRFPSNLTRFPDALRRVPATSPRFPAWLGGFAQASQPFPGTTE